MPEESRARSRQGALLANGSHRRAESFCYFIQSFLQGSLVLAKAKQDASDAHEVLAHLQQNLYSKTEWHRIVA